MKAASLRTRLFIAFAAVAVIGGVVFAVLVRSLVPRFFEGNMSMRGGMDSGGANGGGMNGGGMNGAGVAADTHDAVVSAVNTAMLVALGVSITVALIAAGWLSRRTLRHLDGLRAGTRALRDGEYDAALTLPPEPELRALADDINDLAAALAGVERRRASLINDVAHEMRTPLTTITGHLEGLQDGLFSADEAVAAIGPEVERLRTLAQDLAAVSRAEEGAIALDRTDVDLAALVHRAVDRFGPAATNAGVAVGVDAPAELVVNGDPLRLDQVVANLLQNAIAYTPSGGHVRVAVSTDGASALVTVTDDGRGLSDDQLRQVFERFYRADPQDHTGGTGVGLTIARAIARAHGGDVVARSDGPGLGSQFELSLPC